jgi:hypothetical protein
MLDAGPAPELPPCTILPTHHPNLVLLILQHSDNSYKFGNFLMIFVTFSASSLDDHHFGSKRELLMENIV